jgi:hypothetical protein
MSYVRIVNLLLLNLVGEMNLELVSVDCWSFSNFVSQLSGLEDYIQDFMVITRWSLWERVSCYTYVPSALFNMFPNPVRIPRRTSHLCNHLCIRASDKHRLVNHLQCPD